MASSPSQRLTRMDTWFQTNLESPGTSRGTSPRMPRRMSDGEGLFDTFDEDAQWNEWEGADRAPTPVAERAAASQPRMSWGSLLSIVAPQPARAVAERSSGREQTSDAALERAVIFVQRLIRGKIARLDAAETTRTFKLLELYVRCTSLRRCTSRPCRLAPHPTPHTPRPVRPAPRASRPTPRGQARAEEKAAMAVQSRQRHRVRCRREAAAVRLQAVARGMIARRALPPKAEPTSSAYCSPRAAGSDLDLASVRGLVFKRSRGWPRYQLRYFYFSVDGAGQAALCHRTSDAVGGGTGVEKRLPCSSITAVHVESWGRCVVTLALAQPQPLPSPSPSPAP